MRGGVDGTILDMFTASIVGRLYNGNAKDDEEEGGRSGETEDEPAEAFINFFGTGRVTPAAQHDASALFFSVCVSPTAFLPTHGRVFATRS